MFNPLDLEGKSPAELHLRRQEIVMYIGSLPRLDDAPTTMLEELSYICGALRRKNAGPPRVAKPAKRSQTKATVDDILGMFNGNGTG